jgi:hypothetical protein
MHLVVSQSLSADQVVSATLGQTAEVAPRQESQSLSADQVVSATNRLLEHCRSYEHVAQSQSLSAD